MFDRPVLVIYANPRARHSRLNRPLAQALAALPGVEVRDLYRLYPDYDIDVVAEQRALARASTVVLQFPMSWFAMPPMLKLWFDQVLERGWAHGPGGTALRGKRCTAIVTPRGAEQAYAADGDHGHGLDTFLLPLERSALLCGMSWLPPVAIFEAYQLDDDAAARTIADIISMIGQTAGPGPHGAAQGPSGPAPSRPAPGTWQAPIADGASHEHA